ncbi:hypothetical protein BFF78_06260 [Streptomyces fodineus]|uniref:Uncharacterized protein n=1 Tax=Streptomyces fodineus TaxID=1904616 RepID=A0A1D7Y574_9ACTN|nr:hypothetical protein BFF78_06260 [Streptomyces fodineus]
MGERRFEVRARFGGVDQGPQVGAGQGVPLLEPVVVAAPLDTAYAMPVRPFGAAVQRATLTFGIRYEEGVLAWMDDIPAILGPPDKPSV